MKEPTADRIRNIAVVSYTGAGTTSLSEALLYTAGAIPAMGSVLRANTGSASEPEEIHRSISIRPTASAMRRSRVSKLADRKPPRHS